MRINQLLASINHERGEAEIILADILGKDRSFLFAHPDYNLSKNQSLQFIDKSKRRDKGKPLAYILGYKEFYGFRFFVDKRVLIPRPETEGIIDKLIEYSKEKSVSAICDVGTGSGCIAITLAKKLPKAKIYATDISKEALNVAKKNAKYHHLENKITFLNGDLLHPLPEKVDVIVANLPYIKTSDMNNLKPQISNWEPRIALDGGNNGKLFYNRLFSKASNYLKPGGKLFYEFNGKIHTKTFNNLDDS